MRFHLDLQVPPFPFSIDHDGSVLMTGSCFAEEIGTRLQQSKFNTCINPHGILYDPFSIAAGLRACVRNEKVKEEELFLHNGLWSSFRHHGRFSHTDKRTALENMNAAIDSAHHLLRRARLLVITFGSAFFYRHRPKGIIAGNCHKLPGTEFSKELSQEEDILAAFRELFISLKQHNPALNIILTVSPVRYIRDGIVENNLSKAVLIKTVHALCGPGVYYFPAYELVIDDLRDHRFFGPDLVHPNEQAVDYVWERFCGSVLSEKARQVMGRVQALQKAAAHRILHPGSSEHLRFAAAQLKICQELEAEYPLIDLSEEKRSFESALTAG